MKPRCPKCASERLSRTPSGWVCDAGHFFNYGEPLISLQEAVTFAKALSHPLRRRIMLAFGEQDEWSAIELTRRIGTQAFHHVKVLRATVPPILVETRTEKRRGATERFYKINPRLIDAGEQRATPGVGSAHPHR